MIYNLALSEFWFRVYCLSKAPNLTIERLKEQSKVLAQETEDRYHEPLFNRLMGINFEQFFILNV